jgi:hypothetical protein
VIECARAYPCCCPGRHAVSVGVGGWVGEGVVAVGVGLGGAVGAEHIQTGGRKSYLSTHSSLGRCMSGVCKLKLTAHYHNKEDEILRVYAEIQPSSVGMDG